MRGAEWDDKGVTVLIGGSGKKEERGDGPR
jgi:hypothetical protein